MTLFSNVLMFLLNKIDPNFECVEISCEDFASALNAMGSPIQLSKTVFNSLGAPNSWSHVLGVLNWLCEFL